MCVCVSVAVEQHVSVVVDDAVVAVVVAWFVLLLVTPAQLVYLFTYLRWEAAL